MGDTGLSFPASLSALSGHGSIDDKQAFLDRLISQLTVEELAFQLPLISGNWVVGPKSDHSLYDNVMHLAPNAGLGVTMDWYPTQRSQYNTLQALNLEKSRSKIPLMNTGECLRTIWSNKHTVFPHLLALSTSFDVDLVHRVARAIGTEGRSIGLHACFAPVLDVAKEPRYGRSQETFGEDFVLVSHMGVAYCSGLSKNGDLSAPDAMAPVIKHFAGHGAPSGGLHSNAIFARGRRELLSEILVPFKAAIDLAGGVEGIMMSYTAVDEVPAHVDPFLYKTLDDWGYKGFVIGDWAGVMELMTGHRVAHSTNEAVKQWLNAGGGIFLYDFDPDTIVTAILEVVKDGSVSLSTLQASVRRILSVKYDLGLFHNPYLTDDIDPRAIVDSHIPLALEAAHKSIVLLENRNQTLPLRPSQQNIKKIAIIGPFADTFNYGSYTGAWGSNPADNASTIRQGVVQHIAKHDPESQPEVSLAWGTNSWQYRGQYNIPGYLLSYNGTTGGLQATYYHDTEFQTQAFQTVEIPNRDWGLYPPIGLSSNSFSAVWEGDLQVPVSGTSPVRGWIGVAVSAHTTARLFIDGKLAAESLETETGNFLREILPYSYTVEKGRDPPPGGFDFVFRPGARHHIRIEYRTIVTEAIKKPMGVHSKVQLWWNLVDREDPVGQAKQVASDSDLIVLTVGAAVNSDSENGDRATLTLSPDQTKLADAIFSLGKPVVLVLGGGRPFAIPEYYAKSAAVLSTCFLGQAAGQAIADVLFGEYNPGGRLTMSVPYDVGSLPVFYNQRLTKPVQHIPHYMDIPKPALYSFGYGLSYTTFTQDLRGVESSTKGRKEGTFSHGDTLTFTISVTNTGAIDGSHAPQVYLLRRQGSSVTTADKQLVAFGRTYVRAEETVTARLEVEVDRYLPLINRAFERVLEAGEYTFALMDDGSPEAPALAEAKLRVETSHVYQAY